MSQPDALAAVATWLAGVGPLLDLNTDADPMPIVSFLQQAGLDAIYLDLSQATDKDGLLNALHQQLGLGDWFGFNWDALEESLSTLDLRGEVEATHPSEMPDQVLVCHGTRPLRTLAPEDAAVFMEILQNVASDTGGSLRGCVLLP